MDKLHRQMEIDMYLGPVCGSHEGTSISMPSASLKDHFGSPVEEAGIEDVRAYLHHMVERNLSESSIKHAYYALKLVLPKSRSERRGKPSASRRLGRRSGFPSSFRRLKSKPSYKQLPVSSTAPFSLRSIPLVCEPVKLHS